MSNNISNIQYEQSLIHGKYAILEKADQKVSNLKTSLRSAKANPILKQADVIYHLETHQSKLTLVPYDKESNNVAIICKNIMLRL